MDKQKLFFYIILGSVILLIACLIGFILFLKTESATCMLDPIQYYSNKTAQMCYCNNGMGWAMP